MRSLMWVKTARAEIATSSSTTARPPRLCFLLFLIALNSSRCIDGSAQHFTGTELVGHYQGHSKRTARTDTLDLLGPGIYRYNSARGELTERSWDLTHTSDGTSVVLRNLCINVDDVPMLRCDQKMDYRLPVTSNKSGTKVILDLAADQGVFFKRANVFPVAGEKH
ncbi:MAG: hypothetical protein IT381_15945 [Deltaproteobacteria bacterium]|nr:hypothetical protein [Deltaproteobacteria bacterium]